MLALIPNGSSLCPNLFYAGGDSSEVVQAAGDCFVLPAGSADPGRQTCAAQPQPFNGDPGRRLWCAQGGRGGGDAAGGRARSGLRLNPDRLG